MSDRNASPRDETQPASAPIRRRKPRASRGKGLRTTSGCAVCRSRHMKCDEKKPTCSACLKSKRQCVYATTTHETNEGSDVTAPSSAISPAVAQLSAFEGAAHHIDSSAFRPRQHANFETSYQENQAAFQALPHSIHVPDFIRQLDDTQTSSPRSSISGSTVYAADIAPLRWFGLLAGDATNAEWNFNPISPALVTTRNNASNLAAQHTSGSSFARPSALIQGSSTPSIIPQEVVTLSDLEVSLFRYFVTHFSRWIDLTDPHRHFSVMVPHLALRNQGIMKAVLALCTRHLSIKPLTNLAPDRTLAVQYYYETLQYLQQAMKDEAYLRSEELLVTCLIISTYEMIDGENQSWERHLRGIFWVQRSREINGESGGLNQAIWWAWLRQDVWAAFREGRKVFSFFRPTKPYFAMDHWDIAARCVYLVAQTVNYSSKQEVEAGKSDMVMRLAKADELSTKLEDWYQHLTSHFNPLPCHSASQGSFKPTWIHPPVFAAGLQLYRFAKILLQICTPAIGGLKEYVTRERALQESIDAICGIALATEDDAAIVISTQCVFAAGLHTSDPTKRTAILEIVAQHQSRTGWPVHDLRSDLKIEWAKTDDSA